MSALQTLVMAEMSNIKIDLASVDCKGRLAEYKNVIETSLRTMRAYLSATNDA
jgi:hypothetical protein